MSGARESYRVRANIYTRTDAEIQTYEGEGNIYVDPRPRIPRYRDASLKEGQAFIVVLIFRRGPRDTGNPRNLENPRTHPRHIVRAVTYPSRSIVPKNPRNFENPRILPRSSIHHCDSFSEMPRASKSSRVRNCMIVHCDSFFLATPYARNIEITKPYVYRCVRTIARSLGGPTFHARIPEISIIRSYNSHDLEEDEKESFDSLTDFSVIPTRRGSLKIH